MFYRFCYEDGRRTEATALAAQTFTGRSSGDSVYEFHPICGDHLSTWNNGADEQFPVYNIDIFALKRLQTDHEDTFDSRCEHS